MPTTAAAAHVRRLPLPPGSRHTHSPKSRRACFSPPPINTADAKLSPAHYDPVSMHAPAALSPPGYTLPEHTSSHPPSRHHPPQHLPTLRHPITTPSPPTRSRPHRTPHLDKKPAPHMLPASHSPARNCQEPVQQNPGTRPRPSVRSNTLLLLLLLPAAQSLASRSILSTAMKASCGTSTLPSAFMRFLPSACFCSSFFLRLMSPP